MSVPRDFRIKSFLPQMSPERIHIRNVEDQPAPPRPSRRMMRLETTMD
jgi:hypothetical protein